MRTLAVWLAFVIAAVAATAVDAQGQQVAPGYPTKPVRAIIGFAAGGSQDVLMRAMGQKLLASMGQPLVIDNRTGGAGIIAATIVKDAPPDGYTLLVGGISTLATNVATQKGLPYDPVKDFSPVTLTLSNPYFVIVHPSLPVNSLGDFIAYAKTRPGQVTFASSGTGGGAHLSIELFRSMASLDMIHVPYRGAAQAMIDLLAGHINMTFSQPAVVLPHGKLGKVKVLAVTSTKRLASWADAPPIAEAGVPGYEAGSWQGIVVPARTPRPIVNRLHAEIARALHSPEIQDRLAAEGSLPGGNSPEEFGQYIKTEIAKWTKVVKMIGLEAQ